ncbi:MAG: DUF5934 domain-containing protein [Candidatus Competibacteraceae bacterium]
MTVLSVKQYPERVFLGNALRYLGDVTTGTRGVRENLLITATLLLPDAVNSRAALERSGQWVAHQTYSPLLKFVPKLAKRKQGFDLMREAMDNGDRPVRLYLGFVLFTAGREEAITAVANLQTLYRENGLQVLPDRYFCLPLFLHCLPVGGDRQVLKETHRYRTWATRHVVPLLPVLGDWKGTGAPVLTLFSRNGQAMGLDLFQSRSNYNCVIAAASGKGKSFLANQLIESYLETGGRVWVIDVGRSYQKLARVLHGEFLEFKNDGSLRINPFELVRDYSEEEDMLVGLLSAMIAPTRPLADLQTAELKRLLKQGWDTHAHRLTIDQLAAALLTEPDPRVSDMGRQLYAFTREGQYGRFFSGASNVRLEADFIVIELTELKGRKPLQQVVLLLIIYQIQQVMYPRTDELERRELVLIDEAWDLLGAGDVGLFIETGYRRFRKQNGAAITITQGLQDLYDSPGGRAILDNSANRLLLGQSPDAITVLEKAGRLASLGSGGYLLLRTVHTQPGAYAEVLCLTEFGAGIGRVIVDPYSQLLYSTRPADVSALQELMAQGLTQDQAIRTLLERRRAAP